MSEAPPAKPFGPPMRDLASADSDAARSGGFEAVKDIVVSGPGRNLKRALNRLSAALQDNSGVHFAWRAWGLVASLQEESVQDVDRLAPC